MQRRKRGFILLLVMLLIPLCFLLMFTLVRVNVQETQFAVNRMGQSQAFFLAESGLEIAYDAFVNSNLSGTTHLPGTATAPGAVNPGPGRLTIDVADFPGMLDDGPNGYTWRWNPGDPAADSYSNSGRPESFSVQVWFEAANPRQWHIRCEGRYGDGHRATHQLSGTWDDPLRYAIFDDGDLSEFVRGPEQSITGRVHANGDLFIRPSNSGANALRLHMPSGLLAGESYITSARRVIRHKDAWERNATTSGNVKIETAAGSFQILDRGDGYAWSAGNPDGAFDSVHTDWTDSGASGAQQLFSNRVRDQQLGQTEIEPPDFQTLAPGGFYEQKALSGGLVIDSATADPGPSPWITTRTFYNNKEERTVTVKEIDVQRMAAKGKWPANGLIYSHEPIRFVNGDKFPDVATYPAVASGLTVAGTRTLYTKGDFNATRPDNYTPPPGGDLDTPPVALMTTDRIYHLSNAFTDAQHTNGAPLRNANDDGNVVEIHAALIDGAPTVDEIGPTSGGGDSSIVDAWEKAGEPSGDQPLWGNNPDAWANSDDFLEDFNHGVQVTVRKYGTIMHMQNAVMPHFNANPGALPAGTTPWIYHNHYDPPVRDYQYKKNGQSPPFILNLGVRTFWRSLD